MSRPSMAAVQSERPYRSSPVQWIARSSSSRRSDNLFRARSASAGSHQPFRPCSHLGLSLSSGASIGPLAATSLIRWRLHRNVSPSWTETYPQGRPRNSATSFMIMCGIVSALARNHGETMKRAAPTNAPITPLSIRMGATNDRRRARNLTTLLGVRLVPIAQLDRSKAQTIPDWMKPRLHFSANGYLAPSRYLPPAGL